MLSDTSFRDRNFSFTGWVGLAETDITPPVGIAISNWGARQNQVATGVHKSLKIFCNVFLEEPGAEPLILISADLGWWKNMDDENFVRHAILKKLSLSEHQLMFALTHTHAGPSICTGDGSKPGGGFINDYLNTLKEKAIECIEIALKNIRTGTLDWAYGQCSLAKNRDLYLPDEKRFVVGYNKEDFADNTILVGRVTGEDGESISTIVNYACHPTTLAWQNTLISPDYVGAARGTIEVHMNSPCMFLQGASGELAPAEQYSGDTSLSDRHGRVVAHAAISVLEEMQRPGNKLYLKEIVESGAPLAVFVQKRENHSNHCTARLIRIPVQLKENDSVEEVKSKWKNENDTAERERLWRKLNIRQFLGDGGVVTIPVWIWRVGGAIFVGQPNEAYSVMQTELRKAFPGNAIVVLNVVNGHVGYLPPAALYDEDIYSVSQTPFAKGTLEIIIETVKKEIEMMIH